MEWVRLLPMDPTVHQMLITLTTFLQTHLPGFHLRSLTLVGEERNSSMVTMSLVVQRKVWWEVVTTFIPSLMVVAISHLAVLTKPLFKVSMSVNMMSLTTTILLSCRCLLYLPRTNYTKMADLWLLGCQAVIFARILLLLGKARQGNRPSPTSPGRVEQREGRPGQEGLDKTTTGTAMTLQLLDTIGRGINWKLMICFRFSVPSFSLHNGCSHLYVGFCPPVS